LRGWLTIIGMGGAEDARVGTKQVVIRKGNIVEEGA
jgi:hypothetical protein